MTPTKTPREKIQEIMFATCPVDIQEPFFWKWNEHGLDMLEACYNALLEEARQEIKEKILKKIPELKVREIKLPQDDLRVLRARQYHNQKLLELSYFIQSL